MVEQTEQFGNSEQLAQHTAVEWLINHWKKLQSEGEKMNWSQIIQITELAKEMEMQQQEKFNNLKKLEAKFEALFETEESFNKWLVDKQQQNNNNMQQTAVEFLIEGIEARNLWTKELREEAEQAKEMFQQQIETAYNKGTIHGIEYPTDKFPLTGEQYYNKTYGTRLQNETN
jgi:hypothetical protein